MNPADRFQTSPADEVSGPHPLDWLERTGTSDVLLHELQFRRDRRTRRRRAIGAVGGIAALLIMAGFLWRGVEHDPAATRLPSSSSIVSVPERQMLPDGSIVDLNEGAAISVSYTSRARRIVLKQGEAHFQVAKNDATPFIVAVAGMEIRAVGTAFSVVAAPAAVEVLVTEGRVVVDKPEPPPQAAANEVDKVAGSTNMNSSLPATRSPAHIVATIAAGNRIVVETAPQAGARSEPHVVAVPPGEIDERLAWRVPRIEFSGTPLVEAIPIFNRHSRVRVSLSDPALGRLRLSGILRADNVDALVRLLEANFHVSADRRDDEIVLRKALDAREAN